MLKIKQKAPNFIAPDQHEKIISLNDFKGKKLVLYFYPQDNTETCTIEACNLRDNYFELKAAGFEILGVSPDSSKKHSNFIKKYSLPFSLLADVDQKICNDYKVWAEKQLFGRKYMGVLRTTFIIDEKGIIVDIIDKVKAKDHASQIL